MGQGAAGTQRFGHDVVIQDERLGIVSRSPDGSAGNSSCAIKPSGDNETGCGCNSTAWAGRSAYYGGTALAPTVETRIWIR